MSQSKPSLVYYKFLLQTRRLFRQNGFIIRGLLCCVIACIILKNDEVNSYDTRLQLRGDKPISQQVSLVNLQPADFTGTFRFSTHHLSTFRAFEDITDSFYWDTLTWKKLLTNILAQNPKAVLVTLYFPQTLQSTGLSEEDKKLFLDDRILWSTGSTANEKNSLPLWTNDAKNNIGASSLIKDDDGIIRKFNVGQSNYPSLIELATGQIGAHQNQIINYKTITKSYNNVMLKDILENHLPENQFTNKYVIISAKNVNFDDYLTPIGPASKGEVLLNVLDNFVENSFIYRSSFFIYAAGLLLLTFLCVLIITQYPHTVAFFFLLWIATLTGAVSAWVFDSYMIWIPVTSVVVEVATIWVIFIGYQANKIERQHRELQQEQIYLQELEQLKNNFVSLISHDLKTPIAKIQGIVDRILMKNLPPEIDTELKTLRVYNEELNKYIQSILRLLRVESRDFKIHKEVCDINELVFEAMTTLKPLASAKSIDIKTELEPIFSLELDITLIREVLINLIENAIKYTPENGSILVKSYESQDSVYVEVEDTGPGIPPDEIEPIWGKFVRGKDQGHKTKGTGLGLYLVRYFIELHSGKVGLESTKGLGTKVFFTLPLESDT